MCMTNAQAAQSSPPQTSQSCYVEVNKLPTKEKLTSYQLVPHLLSLGWPPAKLLWNTGSCHPSTVTPTEDDSTTPTTAPHLMEFRKWPLAPAILPPVVLSLPTLVFTCRDSTIRTKCLPCQSAEGGTSTAIRANWQHLHSSKELLTSVPTPAALGTSVERSNRPP